MSDRKVLVVGGGLAGAHIASALLDRDWDVDLIDRHDCRAYVAHLSPNGTRPTQAAVTEVDQARDVIARSEWTHVVWALRPGDGNVTEAYAACAAETFTYISSLAVYGPAARRNHERTATSPSSDYGRRKLEEERSLGRVETSTDLHVLRTTGLIGALEHAGRGSRSARAVDGALRDGLADRTPRLELEVTPDQYLHASDLGRLIDHLLAEPDRPGPGTRNVGPGILHTPHQVASTLEGVLGSRVELVLRAGDDDPAGLLEIHDVQERCDFAPTTLRDGVAATLEALERSAQ